MIERIKRWLRGDEARAGTRCVECDALATHGDRCQLCDDRLRGVASSLRAMDTRVSLREPSQVTYR